MFGMSKPEKPVTRPADEQEAVMAWEDKPAFAGSAAVAAPAKSSSPLIAALLTVIALLLAVVIYLVMAQGRAEAPAGAQAGPTAGAQAQPGGQEAQGGEGQQAQAQPQEMPSFAPSLTDPKALEALRGEPRRQEGDPFALGKVDAPVVLIEYADFACPFCTRWAQNTKPELMRLVEDGTLRIEWRNLPVLGPESQLAAQGAVAAGNQGMFWEFYDHLFGTADPNSHPSYSEESLVAAATAIGIPDIAKFTADLTSQATVDAVQAELQHANQALGAASTPLFVINDTAVAGAYPTEFFLETIRYQLLAAQQ